MQGARAALTWLSSGSAKVRDTTTGWPWIGLAGWWGFRDGLPGVLSALCRQSPEPGIGPPVLAARTNLATSPQGHSGMFRNTLQDQATKALPHTGPVFTSNVGRVRELASLCSLAVSQDLNTPRSQELSELVGELTRRMEANEEHLPFFVSYVCCFSPCLRHRSSTCIAGAAEGAVVLSSSLLEISSREACSVALHLRCSGGLSPRKPVPRNGTRKVFGDGAIRLQLQAATLARFGKLLVLLGLPCDCWTTRFGGGAKLMLGHWPGLRKLTSSVNS